MKPVANDTNRINGIASEQARFGRLCGLACQSTGIALTCNVHRRGGSATAIASGPGVACIQFPLRHSKYPQGMKHSSKIDP